jgi:CRISPR-associated endonuclease Csn1
MTVSLGLDVGSNSVGSAWVDTEKGVIDCGVSVFPSGVDQKNDDERGEPINRERRQKRQLRKVLERRAIRRRKLLAELVKRGLLPADPAERVRLFGMFPPSPWHLRKEGLHRQLTPYEFGRILVHLNQRRGAFGVHVQAEEKESGVEGEIMEDEAEGKVRASIQRLNHLLGRRTFGEFMAEEFDTRQHEVAGKPGKYYCDPIRNRRNSYEYCPSRETIRAEFLRLWDHQTSEQYKGGALYKSVLPAKAWDFSLHNLRM